MTGADSTYMDWEFKLIAMCRQLRIYLYANQTLYKRHALF